MRCGTIVLMLSLLGLARAAHAQQQTYVSGGDTLHYTYTPLPEGGAGTDATPKKKNIFHRFVDYFGGSTTDRTFEKKIDFTFAGGPSYSKNTSFGIGILAAGLYRIDRTDSVTQPSNISIFGNVSVSGFYALGVTGNTVWDRGAQRANYTASFSSAPRDSWGFGYRAGRHNPKTDYVEKRYLLEGRYLHRVLPGMFAGGLLSFQHTRGKKFDERGLEYLGGQHTRYTATGIGALLEYDSRDVITNPFRGVYVSFQETFFPKALGSLGESVWRTSLTADWYKQVWQGGVLATDFYAEFNSEGAPWPLLARMGGSYRMRGYYEGRYTDNDLMTLQVELRQRIWRRIGCTVWVGAGNVFPELKRYDWSETLPNYGIGFRWELKKRVNVRIDYGFGKDTSGFMLNVNEAF